jgi:TolB-like protein/DNA-binding winged helix-turn-helix (wHTH) protein/Flp pilus assembly protein TadD
MGRAAGVKLGFEDFELDVRSGELRKSGVQLKLQVQPFKVLAFLVSRAGQVVTRQEICRHVWGGDTFVDYEQGLNYCIRQIRAALGEDATRPRYIGTHPRRGYRFLVPVLELPTVGALLGDRVMLAVLPLENLSRDPEQEYFADGLTDEIITELGCLSPQRLGVIARTSAIQYKRTTKGIDQIGRELGVDYIVEGAVHRDGSRLRITAQLIRVSDQTHVWAHGYERQLQDVLLLQSELASAIAAEVQVQLVPQPRPRAASGRRVNPEAYETCLKARFFWNRRTREGLYRALELFSKSIERDTDYAPAFAGMADTYLVMLDYRYMVPNEALAMATAAAVNALRLDERLADAHTSLAHAKLHALDWDGAEQEFRKAIELGPGYALAHFYYASFLGGRGRFEDAIAEACEAVRLDPVSMVAEAHLAILYYSAGRYDDALESCRKALEMEPALPRPYDDLGRILLEKGASSEAIAALEKAVSLSNRGARCLSSLGYGYGVTGKKEMAREILAELTGMSKQGYVASSDFALVNAGMGEVDQAIRWLERACEERDSHLVFLAMDPRLASLHADLRFKALLKRVGLERGPRAQR